MMHLLLAIALAVPRTPTSVDRVELNHTQRCGDEHTLTQLIIWRSMHMERYESHVPEWRQVDVDPATDEPRVSAIRRDGYWLVTFFHCGEEINLRARVYRPTFTKHDPEFADRDLLAETDRMPYLRECE